MFTTSADLFKKIQRVVPVAVAEVQHVVTAASGAVPAGLTMAIVDGKWEPNLHGLLEQLAAHAVYTVLVDDERHIGDSVPEALAEGLVDDLLLTPIRPLELLSKIKHVEHLTRINEIVAVNADLKSLIEKFEEDIRTTRAIQRSLIPEKFAAVPGLKVTHKYLSGLKSGGDYLDFFEFEDKTHVGILMSDSSGYGLSSAFMSVILRLAMKFSKDDVRHPSLTISRVLDELQVTMKPTENLSIFYGILNRKTFELTYASGGSIQFIHQPGQGALKDLSPRSHGFGKGEKFGLKDKTAQLMPGDRVTLFSDGFGENFVGQADLAKVFDGSAGEDPIMLINEMSYRVKSKFESDDDMPTQDCSVMIIDIEKRAMRLAK